MPRGRSPAARKARQADDAEMEASKEKARAAVEARKAERVKELSTPAPKPKSSMPEPSSKKAAAATPLGFPGTKEALASAARRPASTSAQKKEKKPAVAVSPASSAPASPPSPPVTVKKRAASTTRKPVKAAEASVAAAAPSPKPKQEKQEKAPKKKKVVAASSVWSRAGVRAVRALLAGLALGMVVLSLVLLYQRWQFGGHFANQFSHPASLEVAQARLSLLAPGNAVSHRGELMSWDALGHSTAGMAPVQRYGVLFNVGPTASAVLDWVSTALSGNANQLVPFVAAVAINWRLLTASAFAGAGLALLLE